MHMQLLNQILFRFFPWITWFPPCWNHTAPPHHHNHFTALFPGPPGWAGTRRELLDFMVQGKINRGRHINHPAGRHSIRTNQCPPPPSPHIFYRPDALTAAQPTASNHWRQLADSDYGEDARVFLNSVTCTVSLPYSLRTAICNIHPAPHCNVNSAVNDVKCKQTQHLTESTFTRWQLVAHTVEQCYFWLQRSSLQHWAHHQRQVLFKVFAHDLAHPSPCRYHVWYLNVNISTQK